MEGTGHHHNYIEYEGHRNDANTLVRTRAFDLPVRAHNQTHYTTALRVEQSKYPQTANDEL